MHTSDYFVIASGCHNYNCDSAVMVFHNDDDDDDGGGDDRRR